MFTLADELQQQVKRDSWSNIHELVAQLIELVSLMRIEALLIAGVKRSKLPSPYHVPRPGEKAKETPVLTPSQFARLTVVQ